MLTAAALIALLFVSYPLFAVDTVPQGRVALLPSAPTWLETANSEIAAWELISPDGSLVPDADGDPAPWSMYLSNDPYRIHASSLPGTFVFAADGIQLDVIFLDYTSGDLWYTNGDGLRIPGPILPLSTAVANDFELVVDLRDGSLSIERTATHSPDGNWTYSYSISSASASLIPDPDGNPTPYLTYMSNSTQHVWAATSRAVVLDDRLTLDAKLQGLARDIEFKYEILGDGIHPPTSLRQVQASVRYVPEPVMSFWCIVFTIWVGHLGRFQREKQQAS